MVFSTEQAGSKYSLTFRMHVADNEGIISSWHDVPLYNGVLLNCINEIPRFEHGKFEINKALPSNPITQDVKKGKLRFVGNVYPFYGYPVNYGALPQTWEDPSRNDRHCGVPGDNDPLDVVEIGARRKEIGEVYEAKVLGALGLLDDGEADWKIFVIDARDAMAARMNDIEDVRRECPWLLDDIFRWFRDYKVPDGKPKNTFALDGRFLGREEAMGIVAECHASWKRLLERGHEGVSAWRADGGRFEEKVSPEPDAPLPPDITDVHYIGD